MLTPVRDLVIVALIGLESKTRSGLFLPGNELRHEISGIVKYIGPQVKDIAVGDYVMFNPYSGSTIGMDGESKMLSIPADQIYCKIGPRVRTVSGLYMMVRGGGYSEATYEWTVDCLQDSWSGFQATSTEQQNSLGNKMMHIASQETLLQRKSR